MEGECAPVIGGANETSAFGPLGDLRAICPWRNVPSLAAASTCCNFGNKANGDIAQMTIRNSAGITIAGYGAFKFYDRHRSPLGMFRSTRIVHAWGDVNDNARTFCDRQSRRAQR